MRTARSSSRLGGGVVFASVHAGIPPCVGLETPLGVGLETPQVWAWRPPQARPLNFPPPGVGLETCKACWGTTPPVNRITDTCENITLPELRCEW